HPLPPLARPPHARAAQTAPPTRGQESIGGRRRGGRQTERHQSERGQGQPEEVYAHQQEEALDRLVRRHHPARHPLRAAVPTGLSHAVLLERADGRIPRDGRTPGGENRNPGSAPWVTLPERAASWQIHLSRDPMYPPTFCQERPIIGHRLAVPSLKGPRFD